MGCCGKNRMTQAELAKAKNPSMPSASVGVSPRTGRAQILAAQPVIRSLTVRYLEQAAIVVRGPVSGLRYAFSGTSPLQTIDARDAGALLNTHYFRRA
jgi:hypothetical protein